MKYDFDTIIDRRHGDSLKWNVGDDVLPLWVADMDFQTFPGVIKAIRDRANQGIYGYSEPSLSWAKAYRDFFAEEYNWEFEEKDVIFATGVVPILSSSVRAFSSVDDEIILMPPVYNIFYNSILNSHRKAKEVPLLEENGRYYFDFPALEKAFSSPKAKLCLLCNPGNPTARIWDKEELIKLSKLAKKHNVIILSDEIHGPLTPLDKKYVPFLSASKENEEIGFVATSPSKAFNLAGIQTAAIIVRNEEIRKKIERQINTDEVAEPNVFACLAAETALNEGREWLKELRSYLFKNREYAFSYIQKSIPLLRPYEGVATYLLWIDASKVTDNSKELVSFLKEKAKILLNDGNVYGKGGEGHLRLNLATPFPLLQEGLSRLKKGIEEFLLP